MRELEINKQLIYYALFKGYTDAVDSNGYKTGEKTKSYEDPVPLRINVSPARNNASREAFGIDTPYDRTMSTGDLTCPIAEDTILWIGISPESDIVGVQNPHNYYVQRVSKSLNDIVYAIKEVTLSV